MDKEPNDVRWIRFQLHELIVDEATAIEWWWQSKLDVVAVVVVVLVT